MKMRTWIILGVIAVLLCSVCACVAAGLAATSYFTTFSVGTSGVRVSESTTTELRVETPASVVIRNDVGQVDVRAGGGSLVQVTARKEARDGNSAAAQQLLERIEVRAHETDAGVQIEATVPDTPGGASASVELEVRVPRDVTLDVRTGVGKVSIAGITGGLSVSTGVGEIQVEDVRLATDSQLDTGVGEVNFEGRLPDSGEVVIVTRTGDITVRLPDESQFLIDASTSVGRIESEFDVQDRETGPRQNVVSNELRGRVGANPRVTLRLQTGTGSIDVGR